MKIFAQETNILTIIWANASAWIHVNVGLHKFGRKKIADANAHKLKNVKKMSSLIIMSALADRFVAKSTTGTKNGTNADAFADNYAG